MNADLAVRDDPNAAPMALLKQQLADRAAAFADLMPSHLSVEKLQRTILVAAQLNPTLLQADRRTFLTACMKAAQDGLLPDGREAAIVPFKSRQKDPATGQWGEVRLAQYMPMVFGLRKKILQTGEVSDLFASVVYRQEVETGRFVYEEGSNRTLRHRPILEPDFRPNDDDIVLAYSVATFADGTQSFEVMRRYEIDDVRNASQTGAEFNAKGEPRDAKGPWVDWFGEMAKKTVIRRHSKSLPQSGDIMLADVEGRDMAAATAAAARSTVALLDQNRPDAPTPLIATDEPFDPATGELGPQAEGGTFDDEVSEPEPKPDPVPEPTPTPSPKPDPVPPGQAEPTPDDAAPAAGVDEVGITKPAGYKAAEEQAEAYIARARSCELLIDLRNLEKEADLVVASMPDEIAACVDTEFDKARKRLTPARRANPGA